MRKHAYRLQFIFLAVAIESACSSLFNFICYELGSGRNEDWLEEIFRILCTKLNAWNFIYMHIYIYIKIYMEDIIYN